MPIRVSYTFTQAEFTQAFESEFDPWGAVEVGDALPYLAPHQFNASLSWQSDHLECGRQRQGHVGHAHPGRPR